MVQRPPSSAACNLNIFFACSLAVTAVNFRFSVYKIVFLVNDYDIIMANRTRSAAWEFFSKTGNANLAKCHICCSILAYSGTTNLLKHLRARHSAETAAVMQWSSEDGEERTETHTAVEAITQAKAENELNDSGASGSTISPGQRSGRKNRSLAWNCFRKIAGKNVAECLFCGVHIAQEHGTTTCLMKHFMGKHPDVYAMHVEGQEAVSIVSGYKFWSSLKSGPARPGRGLENLL